MAPQSKGRTYREVVDEAVNWFAENGFTSEEDLRYWEERISRAADAAIGSTASMESMLRDALRAAYEKMIERGGAIKYHPGIPRFALDRVRPELRAILDRRIMASANLIRLKRTTMKAQTLSRLSGWVTSIPAGGSDHVDKRAEKEKLKKALASLPFETRRVLTDQGHKLISAVNETIAEGGGAIAAVWHSRFRQPGYDYREDHRERDSKVYGIEGSWAYEKGLAKKPPDGWTDEITKPAEEPFCRCSYVYVYTLGQLEKIAPDALTEKGRAALADAREKIKGSR